MEGCRSGWSDFSAIAMKTYNCAKNSLSFLSRSTHPAVGLSFCLQPISLDGISLDKKPLQEIGSVPLTHVVVPMHFNSTNDV